MLLWDTSFDSNLSRTFDLLTKELRQLILDELGSMPEKMKKAYQLTRERQPKTDVR